MTEGEIKTEIEAIVSALKKEGKIYLAQAINENWRKTMLDYSAGINDYKTDRPMENIFKKALSLELKRLSYNNKEILEIIKSMEKHRVLQTSPHISPAQKPRYFFIDYLSSLALQKNEYYFVAMFSGVPFSNKTRPGRLSKDDGDINLIPSSMQDALVYQSKINEKIIENISKLEPKIKKFLPQARVGDSYTAWALKTVKKIEKDFLHGKPIFFDFNEVAKNYLLLALKDLRHPLTKLLFYLENVKKLEELFKDEVFFYRPAQNTKYKTLESYYLKSGALQSNKNKIVLTKENLARELAKNRLCVGLPLGFLIYSFLNNFLCEGSFAQTEYMPMYNKKLLKITAFVNLIKSAPSGILTTGGFKEDLSVTPLDLRLGKKVDLNKYKKTLFGEAILAIKDVLLNQNYSSKYEKTAVAKTKNGRKKAHFIGICGKGMSGLAIMLKQEEFIVTGSDEGFYEPVISLLKKNNISFFTSYKKENIPDDADFIIIGKHAKLVPETNEEVKAAFASGITIKSLPEVIGDLIKEKENTVIAGSFGKSTMTAFISFALSFAKQDPSYFIGAAPLNFKQNAHLGKGKDFILEGDEYPSANWDQTSKFLYMRPLNAIFISGEHDHINIFPTEKDYIKPYEKFVKLLPKGGLLIACRSGKNVEKISKLSKAWTIYYGLNEKKSYHAENIVYSTITSFDLYKNKQKIIGLETTLLGEHNIENIIGGSAFLLEKKLIKKDILKEIIRNFKGLSGRLDLKTKKSSVLIYEGFGSSYSKAKSVFDALKLHFPNKKLTTIFEPHTFSWRNKESKKWYENIFNTSSNIVLLPPPEHGKDTHNQMSFEEIETEIKKNNANVYIVKSEKEALDLLARIVKDNEIIALVSSGSLLGLTSSVPKLMEKMFPKK